MSRTVYVDSCVLILALQAQEEDLAARLMAEITDPAVRYIFSPLVELEVLPKPTKRFPDQAAFFNAWFANAERIWYSDDVHLTALDQAKNYDIAPMDAAHVATAIVGKADELITGEKPTKPMFNTKDMKVRSVRAK